MRTIKSRGKPLIEKKPVEEGDGPTTQEVVLEYCERDGKYDGSFVYGNLVFEGDQPYIVGNFIEANEDWTILQYWIPVIPETVGQFVGTTDDGTEVYEGDIVDGYDGKEVVKYDEEYGVFEPFGHGDYATMLAMTRKYGNIHDNPELLK